MVAAYEWYQRGLALLSSGDAHAAATALEKAADVEPEQGSIREALGRAYYGAGRFGEALEQFNIALEISPVNDYALFGAGLCLGRLGRMDEAVGHLKMANVMRPEVSDYEAALARHEVKRALLDNVRRREGSGD